MEYVLDATGKKMGRVAAEAAHVLMGKNVPSFKKNVSAEVTVKVLNVDKLDISQRKAQSKVYTRYTGYPGGLRKETLSDVISKKGEKEALWRAVYGMLPGNKLRKPRMKNLIIE